MAYNNNVPLGNQTIAQTTDPIRNNFAFLDTSIGQEHNFDITDATKTYHLQASMPNQALPGSLPAGTNGIYFVNSGKAFFYDGTNSIPLNPVPIRASISCTGSGVAIGTPYNATSSFAGGTFTINFTASLPTTNYQWYISGISSSSNNPIIGNVAVGDFTTSSIKFKMINLNGGVSGSVVRVNVTIFGG